MLTEQIEDSNDKSCQQQSQNPAFILAEAINTIIWQASRRIIAAFIIRLAVLEKQVNAITSEHQENAKWLSSQLIELQGKVGQVSSCQQQLVYSQEAVEKQLTSVLQQIKLLENAASENHLLSQQHYQKHIIEPMVRSLFPVLDMIEDIKRSSQQPEYPKDSAISEVIDCVGEYIRQFLASYGIDSIEHEYGAAFEPQVMKPVKLILTEKVNLDRRVAKCLQAGFRLKDTEVLRLESVALFKYQEPLNDKQNQV
jgi:molecular chaperone GrpE (heat shock protein)